MFLNESLNKKVAVIEGLEGCALRIVKYFKEYQDQLKSTVSD